MQIHIYAATARCSIYCIYRPQYFPCRNIFRIFSISLGGIYSVFSLVFQYFHWWNIFSIFSIFLCGIYSVFSAFTLVEYIHPTIVFFSLHWYSRAPPKVIFPRGFAIENNLHCFAHTYTCLLFFTNLIVSLQNHNLQQITCKLYSTHF